MDGAIECKLAAELMTVSDTYSSNYIRFGIEHPLSMICDNYVSKDTIQPLMRAESTAEIEVLAASGALADIPEIYVTARKNFIIENFETPMDEDVKEATYKQIWTTHRLMDTILYGDIKEEVPADLLPLTCDFIEMANNDVEISLELSKRRSVHWKFIHYMKSKMSYLG